MSAPYPFNEDHHLIRETIKGWLSDWDDNAQKQEKIAELKTGFDLDSWKQFACEQGMTSIAIEEAYGGAGLGRLGQSIIMEEMGYVLFAAPFFSTCVLSADMIMAFGSETIKSEILPQIAQGSLTLSCVCDAHAYTQTHSTVSGSNQYVLDATHTDMFILPLFKDEMVTLYLCPSTTAGVKIIPQKTLDPLRSLAQIDCVSVSLNDLREIGTTSLDGFKKTLQISYGVLASESIGGAQRCLDMTLDYTNQRVQFDRTIASFQAVKHRCADMFIALEAARSAAYLAANSSDEDALETALIAKACGHEMFFKLAGDAIQLHGGIGFTWEYPLHYFFKRARANRSLFGQSSSDYEQLAGLIGLGDVK